MSVATRDMAIEAALAFMFFLLLMSLLAIIRMPPAGTAPTAGVGAESDPEAGLAAPAQVSGGQRLAAARSGKTDGPSSRRGRYVGRHGRSRVGRTPPQRTAGPPWGPAESPPAQRP